ncbi:hypothetical protein E2C01_006206 [Portunus trituberculatus]|uniref:Uncharacterized protein n=1 Tax=Portunus trituberculatus TaxID=210409 RepID=A0A5B7CVQ2_PORTR|nr:hypothetical protein [Portunus trituberculatus]
MKFIVSWLWFIQCDVNNGAEGEDEEREMEIRWEEKGEEEELEEGDAVRGFDIRKNSCEGVMGEGMH